MAPLGVPVVPPVYISTARSPGARGTGCGSCGAEAMTSCSQWVSGSPEMSTRWPPFFSLATVNRARNRGGKYSLTLVTMTCSSAVRGPGLAHPGVVEGQAEGHPAAGVGRLVGELLRRVQGVGGHGHAPGLPDGLVGDDRLRAVGQEHRDAVALDHAHLLQGGGEAVGEGVQFPEGEGAAEVERGRACRGTRATVAARRSVRVMSGYSRVGGTPGS